MCHQSKVQGVEQIEQMVENGMPRKIVKTVAYTLKKRAAAKQKISNNSSIEICKICSGCLSVENQSQHNVCQCNDRSNVLEIVAKATEAIEEIKVISTASIPKGCGRAAALAATAARMSGGDPTETQKRFNDALVIFTQLTQLYLQRINQFATRIQKSKPYMVLTKTTQPAHIIAITILSFVLLSVWPNILESKDAALKSRQKKNGLALVCYLGAFATHFGAQIWMTFVSGLSLYFSLPRHTFGLCQQILFPKYFALNSVLSICTLILFIKVIAGRWEYSSYIQLIALTLCAVIEVAVRLYLAPPLLRLMREKHKFEVNVGSGEEVGTLELGDLVKCPHYQRIHKAFRRIHMTVAMGNMAVLGCAFLHLQYLASKISVS